MRKPLCPLIIFLVSAFFLSPVLALTVDPLATETAKPASPSRSLRGENEIRRQIFREKLEQFRDERKKAILQRLEERWAQVNGRRIEHYRRQIERLENLLGRLKPMVLAAAGSEMTVSTKLENATVLLSVARLAIDEQATRFYLPVLQDEATLRQVVGETTRQLQGDLRGVEKKIIEAKQALQDAVRSLRRFLAEKKAQAGTSSAQTQR